jgi:hypothetical protein
VIGSNSAKQSLPLAGRLRRAGPAWITTSAWGLVILIGVAIATFVFLLHRGDPEGASRIANAEIDASLETGERVLDRVAVRQRHWWDYYRQTHGVLAATDRRLIYIGLPPEPLLHANDGPPPLVQASFLYARPLEIRPDRALFGTVRGVSIVGDETRQSFGVAASEASRLDDVLKAVSTRLGELQAVADAERRATEAAAAAARRPIHHLVQPGEALTSIARRYGVSVDSLLVWNGLTSPRIRTGSRLLVRPGQ